MKIIITIKLHVWPPPISNHPSSKILKLSQSRPSSVAPFVKDHLSSCKRQWPLLGADVNDSPVFLTSCKQPVDALSDLYVLVCTMLLRIYEELKYQHGIAYIIT